VASVGLHSAVRTKARVSKGITRWVSRSQSSISSIVLEVSSIHARSFDSTYIVLAAALNALHLVATASDPQLLPSAGDSIGGVRGDEIGASLAKQVRLSRVYSCPKLMVTQEKVAASQYLQEETKPASKREESIADAGDEIKFVGSKRVKRLPTTRDEVIVLD
jgi:hypothetical protein